MIADIRQPNELVMRISERGQITIPKPLRDRYGMNHNVEVEITPTDEGLLIRKQPAEHPIDKIAGILDGVERPGIPNDVDEYIEEIRGRGFQSEAEIEAFWRKCDEENARAGIEREPDWEEHLKVLNEEMSRSDTGT